MTQSLYDQDGPVIEMARQQSFGGSFCNLHRRPDLGAADSGEVTSSGEIEPICLVELQTNRPPDERAETWGGGPTIVK